MSRVNMYSLRVSTALPASALSLLGLFGFAIQAAEDIHQVHKGTHATQTSEVSGAETSPLPANDHVVAETQFPPGTVGLNWPNPVEDSQWFSSLLVDQLEYRMKDSTDTLRWDIVGWYGGDYNRLWLKTEGEWQTSGERGGEAETQVLYGRLIAPFWDFQIGLRYDQLSGVGFSRSRGFAVIGLQGLAPYWFEVEPAIFVSQDGDVSARLTVSYDVLVTQRLVLQTRLDIDAAIQSVEQFNIGAGVDSVEVGMRLRYELCREFAPYIGVLGVRRIGETADIARRSGGHAEDNAAVFGVRLWF